jgi:hypothetical protein
MLPAAIGMRYAPQTARQGDFTGVRIGNGITQGSRAKVNRYE